MAPRVTLQDRQDRAPPNGPGSIEGGGNVTIPSASMDSVLILETSYNAKVA